MPKTYFPAVVELSDLNGKNGFKINGEAEGDFSGYSVSRAGDINGDGIDDIIIGAYQADPNDELSAGSSYVVFGSNNTWTSPFELSALNGTNGFKINGEAEGDFSGYSVSAAGDVNGDSIDDLIVGAYGVKKDGIFSFTGASYVIFGKKGAWETPLELSTLNGANGCKIKGENGVDSSGYSVSAAGDVNGDNIDDLIIGAYYVTPDSRTKAGASYVVFGHSGAWPGELELSTLNGATGFKINGEISHDNSGEVVSYAGDINGDGFDDIVIGAHAAVRDTKNYVGCSYVIFGHGGVWTNTIELSALDGTTGFKMSGEMSFDNFGVSASYAGDINGDGFDDLIIGAYGADPDEYRGSAGSSYVIFGHNGTWLSSLGLSTLDGGAGFKINGETENDNSGNSVSYAGDINHDGIADFIIGADGVDPEGKDMAGSSYVVFGQHGVWSSELELSTLNGATGFKIHGEIASDRSGYSVSYAGDINGDGFDDIIIGAYYAGPHGKNSAGSSYVVFGDAVTATLVNNQLTISEGETKTLTLSDLSVIDNYHKEIRFSMSALEYGYFENINAIGNAITSFTQEDIKNNNIRFVHDGSEYAPAYNVTIYSERVAYSEPLTADIIFTPIDDMPELFVRRRVLKYVEADFSQVIAPDLTITDVDTPNPIFANATVTITNNFYPEEDVLGFVNQNGIVGDYDDAAGVLILTGSSSMENYQTALRSITYENLAHAVTLGKRTVSFTIHNGLDASWPVVCDISVVKKTYFPSTIELTSLDGKRGFQIQGETAADESGISVSGVGDINGDGFDDFIIGAYHANPNGEINAGSSYVVFGHNETWPSVVELAMLDGTDGFKINGEFQEDYSGCSVKSAGDINGDGITDFIIGAYGASPDDKTTAGTSYVVFGRREAWPSVIELSTFLNGTTGFKIHGECPGDYSGWSVSHIGDMNGDGIDDLAIGAYGVDFEMSFGFGATYIVFGHQAEWPNSLELSTLDGVTGVKIYGEMAYDNSGFSVGAAGDINGDGIADLVIGANAASRDLQYNIGYSYVVFGHDDDWPSSMRLSDLEGVTGFKIKGQIADGWLGHSVSCAGDINNDGFDDLIVGAYGENPGDGRNSAGSSYIIFGHNGTWPSLFDLSSLDGETGFKINGEAPMSYTGYSVNSGDINGDGISDLMIGAYNADPDGRNDAGTTYVIFGRDTAWPSVLELSTLDGITGFKIHGIVDSFSGYSVSSIGDIDGDGMTDLMIGAPQASPGEKSNAGTSYVVFGDMFTAELVANQLTINEGETKTIALSNLNAIDNDHEEIRFIISDLTQGYFEDINDSGISITGFNKTTIENNQVRFVHDGGEDAPAYNITICSEKLACSEPYPANITFVNNVNDAPELTTTVSVLDYVENEVKPIDSGLVITDSDSANLVNATVAVTQYFDTTQDVLGFVNQNGIVGNYNNATGVLTLMGTSSLTNYQTALRNVTYENLSDDPSTDVRTITFVVNDGLASSLPATRNINIISVNDIPVLIATSTPLNYTENDSPIVVDANIVVRDDPDHLNFKNATISIINNFVSSEDTLGFSNQNGIVGSYHNNTGVLTLTGVASEMNYQAALRNITYENLSDNPSTGTRTIKFLVNDGFHESVGVARDINVIAVNDLPVITGSGGTLSYTEKNDPIAIDQNIMLTDGDNTDLTNATVAITDNFKAFEDVLEVFSQKGISGVYDNSTGVLSLTGISHINNYQAILRSVKYYNPSDNPTTEIRTVSFAVNDGNDDSNTVARNINIVPKNDPPVLLNNHLTITEGQNVTLTANELSATDVDNDDAGLVFTVNSVLRGEFKSKYAAQEITTFAQRNITAGDIAFVHAGSSNAPSYFVRVSDGLLTNVEDFKLADIDFTTTNDMPILTRNELTINQGQKKVLTESSLEATDEETPKADLIFTVSDIQHGYFEDLLAETEMTIFVQSKITVGDIQFVHDGSSQPPSYAVAVSDGVLVTTPRAAYINFVATEEAAGGGLLGEIQNRVILAGISGGIGLLFLLLKIYFYRKATTNFKDLTAFGATDTLQQHEDFQQRILGPIAEEIFNRISITEFLGYISAKRMRNYLDAVMRIIVELDRQNVDINFDHISAAGQSLLVSEIAKQTQSILIPRRTCCSCGWCMHCLWKLVTSEVSPGEIERRAGEIAMAINASLQQNHFNTFLSRQSMTSSTEVNVNISSQEMPIEMKTLGKVGMFASPANAVGPMETIDVASENTSMSTSRSCTFSQSVPSALMVSVPIEEETRPQITSFSRDLSQQELKPQNQIIPA